ncbi:hypothetical protein NUM3379_31240 [Kineococcus sp. NUM-3379]
MSTLLDSRAPRPDGAAPVTAADLLPLLPAAVRAALGSLLVVVAAAVVAWTGSASTGAPLSAAVRVGADLWLLAHGCDLLVAGGRVGVVPLGLTLLAAATCVRQVRRWSEEQLAAERPLPWGRAAAVFAGGYALVTAVVALVSRMPGAGVDLPPAPLGGAALAGLVLLGCAVRWDPWIVEAAPPWLRRCLRPAATATALLLGAGALVVAVALVVAHERVLLLHGSLSPGLLGGLLLTAAQVLLLPDLVVWALAWLAGPGFAVGTGTAVTPAVAEVGALPALPVLGAVPEPGALPTVLLAVVVVPALVGAVVGLLGAARSGGEVPALPQRLGTAGGTGLLVAAVVAALAWAASGPAGPGRMAEVGPQPLLTGFVTGAGVAVGMLLAVGLTAALAGARPGGEHVPHRLTRPLPAGTISGRGRVHEGPGQSAPQAPDAGLRRRWAAAWSRRGRGGGPAQP